MVYHWLGWISFASCVLLLAKYAGRTLNSKSVNMHKPLGNAVIGTGAMHGVLSLIKHPQEIAENLSGVLLWTLIVLLARTCYAKTKLKSKWFRMHRHLAIALTVILAVHVVISIS